MKCYLKCVGETRHDPIEIKDDIETFIGRLRATEIKDVMCSRNQGISTVKKKMKTNIEMIFTFLQYHLKRILPNSLLL